jgi:hypothetical protein
MDATQAPGSVLIVWSGTDPGIRSNGRTLSGLLAADPHRLAAIEADLSEVLAGRSIFHQLATKVAGKLALSALAGESWEALQPRLQSGVGSGAKGQPPRLVVALDPVAASVVDAWRARGLLRAPLAGVCCGLRLDPGWGRVAVDRLSVADPTQAEAALGLGLPAEILVPCGIPVCGGFSSVPPEEREAHRRRFGLPTDRPVVLCVTHGLGEETLTGALFQLSMIGERATLLFDVARDEDGAELLRRRAGLYDLAAHMFGKVEEGALLWGASDVVLARPHLYVEARALALRLPLVTLLPDEDEERATAAAWSARGIGRTVESLSTLAAELELQLAPAAVASARQAMTEVSRRSAAAEVARFIAQVRAQSEQILNESRQRVTAPPPEPAPAAEPGTKGPLEPIGVSRAGGAPVESLADLEAAEAEANRQVTEHQQEMERWSKRAALAEAKGDRELQTFAKKEVERQQEAMHRALAELGKVGERRGKLEATKVDKAFRKLELDEALADLKKKME